MKKLSIMAAVALVGASVFASSVKWTASNVYAGNTTDTNDGIAYFVLTTTAAQDSWKAGMTAAEVTTKLGSSFGYTPETAGTYTLTKDVGPLGLSENQAFNAYLVIFDGETVADSTKFYVSATKGTTTLEGDNTASITFSGLKTATQNGGNWTAMAAVPEPTSGLLLLLGMAGLALRRRRA